MCLIRFFLLRQTTLSHSNFLSVCQSSTRCRLLHQTMDAWLTLPRCRLAQLLTIFGIMNQLNLSLQRNEQDIVNAMKLVNVTKEQLQKLRDEGWYSHLEKVTSFCNKYDMFVPEMDDIYVLLG
ncbi:uncharacterized protein LOC130807818 [Amaranthus tricolor]|uniref:uncharacterized protein LOC130807818 n=1 Tax=Amaranthus tricolor TaxID=29722 RepID=UPI00258269CB|nr:uncharacterized protein LOC130807818 [Amaranthus tricolor]